MKDEKISVMGRPREYNRKELADKLISWALLDTSTTLNGFCAENLVPPSKITVLAKDDSYFQQAYELAKAILAKRRENKLSDGSLHVKAYDLNAAVYDYFLKQEKREQSEFEAKLRKDVEENPQALTPQQIDFILARYNKIK